MTTPHLTAAEAARILDPETSREALLPYAFDGAYRLALLQEADRMGAEALRVSTPCDLCTYHSPSITGLRPCGRCPAVRRDAEP